MRHDAICSGDHLGSDTDCDREVEVIQRAKRMPFHIFQRSASPVRTNQGAMHIEMSIEHVGLELPYGCLLDLHRNSSARRRCRNRQRPLNGGQTADRRSFLSKQKVVSRMFSKG